MQRYGDQLVCVRYRYDAARQKRLKTVELVIDEQDWVPGVIFPTTRRCCFGVGFGENDLRERVKEAEGYWNPEKEAWVLPYRKVLERRVVDEELGF